MQRCEGAWASRGHALVLDKRRRGTTGAVRTMESGQLVRSERTIDDTCPPLSVTAVGFIRGQEGGGRTSQVTL